MDMSFEDLKSGKQRLEFGNKEQIKAIDEHQAKYGGEMKTWKVTLYYRGTWEDEVEAHSEEEAIEKAESEADPILMDFEIDDTEAEMIDA